MTELLTKDEYRALANSRALADAIILCMPMTSTRSLRQSGSTFQTRLVRVWIESGI